jgi:hypothetical protein
MPSSYNLKICRIEVPCVSLSFTLRKLEKAYTKCFYSTIKIAGRKAFFLLTSSRSISKSQAVIKYLDHP